MIIWSIAKTTVGDALRKKVVQIFLVVAIGLIVISLSFSQNLAFSAKEGSSVDLYLLKGFGLGLMALAGGLISLVMGVSLIPQEIERRTIYTILSKPVQRYEFIVGKFLGAILTLAICMALMGTVFMGVIAAKAYAANASQVMPAVTAAGGLESTAAQVTKVQLFDVNSLMGVVNVFMQFVLLTSVVMLFSVFFTPTINFFLGLGVYVIGLMASLTETLAWHDPDTSPTILQAFYTVVHAVIPNFDKFNQMNSLLHPEMAVTNMPLYTFQTSLYGLIYALIAMTVAVIIFEQKEV
ncbi:MAG: ABC transporter permease subunit [Armatimonadetes bacterium]|nr:ABC transporter permease subunit [Armatimonadota bacterium]